MTVKMIDRVNAMRALEKAYYDRECNNTEEILSSLFPVSTAFWGDQWLEFREFISSAVKCNRDVTAEQILEAMKIVGMVKEDDNDAV